MPAPPADSPSLAAAATSSFLGSAPRAYKAAVLAALVLNVALWALAGPVVASWALVAEFVAVLAAAPLCHPLPPGGLLALQALALGLTTPAHAYAELQHGLPLLLLVLFMVAAIGLMNDLLVFVFSRALLAFRSRVALALVFSLAAALLSAFLDALTVIAVVMAVASACYRLYFQVVASLPQASDEDLARGTAVPPERQAELERFRAALRGILMHAAMGTVIGGVCTLVGEPQNLMIGRALGWTFGEFALRAAPVSIPVAAVGLATAIVVERFRLFGFGTPIPDDVRDVLARVQREEAARRTPTQRWRLTVQAAAAVLLVLGLGLHVAEVGLIGLGIVVVLAALLGVTDEHRLAEAMKSALPFTALLVVFFAIVAVIGERALFAPVIAAVLEREGRAQIAWMYVANGVLSAISDNVFVASVYMKELARASAAGLIPADQLARLAVAVNMGTNIPSVATPNGQAAFLFLLTSSLAPLLRLSYGRMAWMALPFFLTLGVTGLGATTWLQR